MIWKVPKIWEDSEAWIIGGGPSIPVQFDVPSSIIRQVQNGDQSPSAYSSYMSEIHNKHIIGVNMAYKIGPWIDIVIFGDSSFYLKEKNQLYTFPGLKVTCCPTLNKERYIKYVPHDREHVKGISKHSSTVSWNGNTGGAAINLAVHLGVKRIVLLGFDMKLENNMQHWHGLYNRKFKDMNEKIRKTTATFDKHMGAFPFIAEDAKKMGIEIINASPDSNINCFPKASVKELLQTL